MTAQIKLARLLGAVLVTLALVPWLGISPASATGGGNDKGSSNAKSADKESKDDNGKKDAKSKKSDRDNADDDDKSSKGRDSHDDDKSGNEGTSGGDNRSGNQKVTLCHRTNSDSNPYVTITVSVNSVIKGPGHDGHEGPVYSAGMKQAKQKWGDIIPSFTYPGGSYAGKNWPSGKAIYDAGCRAGDGGGGGNTTTPPPSTTPTSGGGGNDEKVTLCHRTNSETNPYVRITVSINSVVKGDGHDGHNGPIFAVGMKSAKQKWGDIIPSFTYTTKGGDTATYAGKNWPAGQAVFNAGCTIQIPPTGSTTPPVSPSTTPPVSPSTTPPVSPDTSVAPTKIGNTDDADDDDTVVLGDKQGPLARTGMGLPLAAALGLSLALLLAGGALMVLPARKAIERNRRH